jgi:hypothetical protein
MRLAAQIWYYLMQLIRNLVKFTLQSIYSVLVSSQGRLNFELFNFKNTFISDDNILMLYFLLIFFSITELNFRSNIYTFGHIVHHYQIKDFSSFNVSNVSRLIL